MIMIILLIIPSQSKAKYTYSSVDIDNEKISYKQVERGYISWKKKENSNILLIPKDTLYCSSAQVLDRVQLHKFINKKVDRFDLFKMNCFFIDFFIAIAVK